MTKKQREPSIPVSDPPSSLWRQTVATGIAAARRNRVPAIWLWIFGIVAIGGYYGVPSIHSALESVGEFKSRWGWGFSMVSTAIFGGVIPALLPKILHPKSATVRWEFLVFSTVLWAYKGIETDFFYRFQNAWFGTGLDVSTIATKTLVDQFVWVPVFGIVNVVFFYFWREHGYSLKRTWQNMDRHWYRRRVLPVMIANWVVWIPAVAMVYSLPLALQIPMQNLILCFWVLILVFFTEDT